MDIKAGPHDVISCTQPYSNSLFRKLSLWFQHNCTKESYDANRIVCTGLKVVVRAEILPRDFLQTPGTYFL